MKTVKVLVGVAIIALLAVMFLFSPKARADGMHGVRETATEVLVDVPKFCRPTKVKWEIQWEQNADNENVMLSFVKKDEKKVRVSVFQKGHLIIQTIWRGGETIHIPKLANGKPIKVKFLSILAFGDDDRAFDTNNWHYESQNSRWVNGASISPPVRVGIWGKCS